MPSFLEFNDGRKLAYQKLSGKSPGLVFLGGFMSDMTGTKATFLESFCRKIGHSFVRFDYFGHGTSSGQFEAGNIGRWKEDALAVIDQLTEGPQIVVGSSMGGWVMVLMAEERMERIKALVGIAVAPDFVEEFKNLSPIFLRELETKGVCYLPSYYDRPYPITMQLIEDGMKNRVLNRSINIECPVHLLHGMQDSVVPWKQSLKLSEALMSQQVFLNLIKSGDHGLNRPSDLQILSDIIAKYL